MTFDMMDARRESMILSKDANALKNLGLDLGNDPSKTTKRAAKKMRNDVYSLCTEATAFSGSKPFGSSMTQSQKDHSLGGSLQSAAQLATQYDNGLNGAEAAIAAHNKNRRDEAQARAVAANGRPCECAGCSCHENEPCRRLCPAGHRICRGCQEKKGKTADQIASLARQKEKDPCVVVGCGKPRSGTCVRCKTHMFEERAAKKAAKEKEVAAAKKAFG